MKLPEHFVVYIASYLEAIALLGFFSFFSLQGLFFSVAILFVTTSLYFVHLAFINKLVNDRLELEKQGDFVAGGVVQNG